MYPEIETRARQIDEARRQQIAAIRGRQDLSPLGKSEAVAEVENRYRAQIDPLQEEARRRLEADRKKAGVELVAQREDQVNRRRATVGDAALAAIYERRLSGMSSGEILAAYQKAAGDWEKTVIGEFGRLIVGDRLRADNPSGEDFLAANGLDDRPMTIRRLEATVAELDHGDRWVETLDFAGERQRIADAYNVSVERVEL